MNVQSLTASLPPPLASVFPRLRALYLAHADAVWMIALALVALWYALQYNLFLQAIPHDTTFHIYAAQQMLEGHPIYRDVAIIKAPLADFVTVFALMLARAFRISDVMGARLMSLAIVVASTSLTYLAGRVLFRSRTVGVLAGLVMAGWNFYGLRSLTGPEPKAFLILFSLLAFICIAQKRWGWAGVSAALATLAWQPGLMLAAIALGAALVAPFLQEPEGQAHDSANAPPSNRQRLRAGGRDALRVLGGLAAPFAVVIFYLVVNNALSAAWNATIGANVTHLNNMQARTPLAQLVSDNYAEILADGGQYCFSPQEYWLISGGTLGFFGLIGWQLVTAIRRKRAPIELNYTPLILYTLGFAAFSLVDFDFCPDLFPLQPTLALCVGWLGWLTARSIAQATTRWVSPGRMRLLVTAVLAIIIVYVYIWDVSAYRVTGTNFQDQLDVAVAASAYLLPSDEVLTFGDTIVPVTLHLRNSTKILHLGSKSGLGVLATEPGGLQGMIDALDRNPPKLVTLSRENFPEWTDPFYEWLYSRYDEGTVFPRANIRFFVLKQ